MVVVKAAKAAKAVVVVSKCNEQKNMLSKNKMWQALLNFLFGTDEGHEPLHLNPEKYGNLPMELQQEILRLNDHNCGKFLRGLQPFHTNSLDNYPDARRFFRKTVLYSLKQFCTRVSSLELFKDASIHPTSTWRRDGSPIPSLPLILRIHETIREVEANPDMTGTDLAERCKRISDWKNELVQMPAEFQKMIRQIEYLRRTYAANHNIGIPPDLGGKLETYKIDGEDVYIDFYYAFLQVLVEDLGYDDVMINLDYAIQDLQSNIPHDHHLLPSVLQPIV